MALCVAGSNVALSIFYGSATCVALYEQLYLSRKAAIFYESLKIAAILTDQVF